MRLANRDTAILKPFTEGADTGGEWEANVKGITLHTKFIEQFDSLLHCNSVGEWRDLIFGLGEKFGYGQTMLAVLPDRNAPAEPEFAFVHSNYSTAWRNKYDAERLQHIDPTSIHCATKSIPLIWSPEIFSVRKQKEMYEEACGHGLRSGISLPIHGAHNELGMLCFVSDMKPGKRFQQEAREVLPELSYLRDVIFETALPFMKPRGMQQEFSSLTPRELECVKWCAAGKSSWDIAQILHCSEAAVNFHFSNLRRKFGVKSRQQVVVKAMLRGLIAP